MKGLALALLLVAPALAFWSTGHMLIANIAELELKNKHPDIHAIVTKDVDILHGFSKEKGHGFVESSTWADDNKGVAWMAFNNWHFVDTPVIEEGFTGETEFDPNNATWALGQTSRTLKDTRTHSMDDGLAHSFMARYLIHLVGDIHQPLHGAAYYGKEFPKGDRGGNSWKVDYPDNKDISQLHALWDSCVDQYGSIWTPISDKYWTQIQDVSNDLMTSFPRTDKVVADRLKITKFADWAAESHDIAKNFVYDGITPGGKPSEEYMARGRAKVNEQLAVAGYRLADTIVDTYKNRKSATQFRLEQSF